MVLTVLERLVTVFTGKFPVSNAGTLQFAKDIDVEFGPAMGAWIQNAQKRYLEQRELKVPNMLVRLDGNADRVVTLFERMNDVFTPGINRFWFNTMTRQTQIKLSMELVKPCDNPLPDVGVLIKQLGSSWEIKTLSTPDAEISLLKRSADTQFIFAVVQHADVSNYNFELYPLWVPSTCNLGNLLETLITDNTVSKWFGLLNNAYNAILTVCLGSDVAVFTAVEFNKENSIEANVTMLEKLVPMCVPTATKRTKGISNDELKRIVGISEINPISVQCWEFIDQYYELTGQKLYLWAVFNEGSLILMKLDNIPPRTP